MKTLANCSPREFLAQTNKIRKSAEKWIKATDIANIRKKTPILETINQDATKEEQAATIERNAKRIQEQRLKNFSEILDNMLDKHPDETLDLFAMCMFTPIEEIDNHPMSYYLGGLNQIMNDEAVIGFFISLARLEATSISGAAEA